MEVFNAFYYSFSPNVASYITSHDNFRIGMKIVLYPLIGILYVSSLVYTATSFNGEVTVAVAGVLASLAIGLVYLSPILTIVPKFKSSSSLAIMRACSFAFCLSALSLVGLFLAEFSQLAGFLELTSVSVVLSNVALGGLLVPWIFAKKGARVDSKGAMRRTT